MDTLALPRASVLHYLPQDAGDTGIAFDDILVANSERLPMVDHVTDIASREGGPRPTQILPDKLVRDYHRRYRRLRPVRKLESVLRDDRTLLIENYAILQHTYRYTTSFFSDYYRWKNIQVTFWKNAVQLAKLTDRQQYIRCYLPKQLPNLAELRKAEKGIDRNSLGPFNNSNALMLLDIWSWLGMYRDATPMGVVDADTASRINLLWVEGNRWFVLNLGLLSDWLGEETMTQDMGLEGKPTLSMESGGDSFTIQKRFLRALMTLFESRTLVAGSVEVEAPSYADSEDDSAVDDGIVDEVAEVEASLPPRVDSFDDTDLEEDLKQLEVMSDRRESTAAAPEEIDLEDDVKQRCDVLADMGMLSGAEYRRLTKLAGRYKTVRNPYGEGTLESFIEISPEDLTLAPGVQIPTEEINGVTDPSFYNSSLLEFDRRYITELLGKDVVGAVMAMQRAGVIVTDYKVETITDAMSSYEAHTVKVVPTVGTPTTIRFRIPKVDENGVFMANGVRYKLRKQRADIPIRKTSPTRVALTSYHSKLFVDRTTRSTNNYAKWLTNQVMAIGRNPEDNRIVDLKVGSGVTHLDEVPFIYSTLGSRFRHFTCNGIDFNFDYRARYKTFDQSLFDQVFERGMVLCGKVDGELLAVDRNDTFYRVIAQDLDDIEVMGKITDLLPVDPNKAPIEFTEVKIFNRTIPLGLVMGYWFGLETLLAKLGAQPRRVSRSERAVLSNDEWALRFSDETLVFSREDRRAMLILGGFSLYQKVIKDYSVYDFDRADVYFNVMEAMGVGAHYVRELDTLRSMFIDPITKSLLEEMAEPTNLPDLLIRASELLLTDHHPREVDMEYMRIRGYERIAGAVYGEMVRSLRSYKSRPNSPNSKVEMNPQAVWMNIMQDPSIAIVEDINPIQNLKEQEVITFTGHGGRSTRSLVKNSRIYGETDMGVISEGTVDSSNVGVIAYSSADPNLASLRGITRRYDKGQDGPARLLSTSALLSPCATLD